MNAARKLMRAVAERGGRLYIAETGRVRITAPSPLPDDLVETLKAYRDELARELTASFYDPERLQREADRRNAEAARNGWTDRWCACGGMATNAYRERARDVWRCLECAPTRERA